MSKMSTMSGTVEMHELQYTIRDRGNVDLIEVWSSL